MTGWGWCAYAADGKLLRRRCYREGDIGPPETPGAVLLTLEESDPGGETRWLKVWGA